MSSPDLAGKTYGRLTVLEKAPRPEGVVNRSQYWRCVCECGKETITTTRNLRSGMTKSCGCLQKEIAAENIRTATTKHGLSGSRIYWRYSDMIRRCSDPNHQRWDYYGGRGIKVCERWRESIEYFIEDIGMPPSDKHELDRIDNDGNYEPANVRWSTRSQQMCNTRASRPLTYQGKSLSLVEWSKETGIPHSTLKWRYYQAKWPVDKVLGTRRPRR